MIKDINIGIYTYYNTFHRNCGQTLQAYALQEAIKKYADIEVYMLNFRITKYSVLKIGNLFLVKELLKRIKEKNLMRQIKFDKFVKNYLKESPILWTKKDAEIFINKKNITKLVVGSDQVWHPYSIDNYMAFFEVESRCQKFAYSPSLCEEQIANDCSEILSRKTKALDDFLKIGVREKSGKKILEKYCNQSIDVNIDPVFLLDEDEWKSRFGLLLNNDRYILLYNIGVVSPSIISLAENLKDKYECSRIIIIENNERLSVPETWQIKKLIDPKEFLDLVLNACFILGDSFHLLCFSIIFKRQFYIYPAKTEKMITPNIERIVDMLESMGLPERLINRKQPDIIDSEIDYKVVYPKLLPMINNSKKFLSDIVHM